MERYLILDEKIREDNFSLIRRWGNTPDLRPEDEGRYLIMDKKMEENTLIWDKKIGKIPDHG
jgi:hypothetical protein